MFSYTNSSKVGPQDIEYKKQFKGDEMTLKEAVEENLYPPTISVKVQHSEVPEHPKLCRCIKLHVHGAMEGVMNFPIHVYEDKEGV